ncbi:MAG: YciI family protein [Mycobacteriales bacterium]
MRFLMLVKLDETVPAGAPPPSLFAAIEELGKEATKNGTLVDQGGLMPIAKGSELRLSGGKISVTDGPFTEAKEVIGGYSMFELRSKEEAVEEARRFLQAHVDHWPAAQVTVEVRQLMGPDDLPSE